MGRRTGRLSAPFAFHADGVLAIVAAQRVGGGGAGDGEIVAAEQRAALDAAIVVEIEVDLLGDDQVATGGAGCR
ncbi:MAG: hypothetical protein AcusKO_10410 [Acuticoccus sp.]